MNEPEQQFFAWAGRGLLAALVAGVVWFWTWIWNRVHKGIPEEIKSARERLEKDFATQLVKMEMRMESLLRDAIRVQTEQRQEQHAQNGKKLDTISEDIRGLRDQLVTEFRSTHQRIDDHIDRHHSK